MSQINKYKSVILFQKFLWKAQSSTIEVCAIIISNMSYGRLLSLITKVLLLSKTSFKVESYQLIFWNFSPKYSLWLKNGDGKCIFLDACLSAIILYILQSLLVILGLGSQPFPKSPFLTIAPRVNCIHSWAEEVYHQWYYVFWLFNFLLNWTTNCFWIPGFHSSNWML